MQTIGTALFGIKRCCLAHVHTDYQLRNWFVMLP
jgi:hypothetical protein